MWWGIIPDLRFAQPFATTAPAGEKKKKKVIEAVEFENATPPGQKKGTIHPRSASSSLWREVSCVGADVAAPLLKAYYPQAVESAWNDWWTAQGFFSCDPSAAIGAPESNRFVMVIPPPNVTGSLHLGHALTSSVEDALTRWHRMQGKFVMWLPGTDHAGGCP